MVTPGPRYPAGAAGRGPPASPRELGAPVSPGAEHGAGERSGTSPGARGCRRDAAQGWARGSRGERAGGTGDGPHAKPTHGHGAGRRLDAPSAGDKPRRGSARRKPGKTAAPKGKGAKAQRGGTAFTRNPPHAFRGRKAPRPAPQVQQKPLFLQLHNTRVTSDQKPNPEPSCECKAALLGPPHREELSSSERWRCPTRAQQGEWSRSCAPSPPPKFS